MIYNIVLVSAVQQSESVIHIHISETMHLRLGLEPTCPGLEPGQNPDWDLSPRSWDSNPAQTHGLPTEITHLSGKIRKQTGWRQAIDSVLVSGLNEAQVLDVSSQKEFSERQSDK